MYDTQLEHHGVKGMHWGVRRYQNRDGTLTEKGRAHVAKLQKELDTLNGNHTEAIKRKLQSENPRTKKRASEMSMEELDARIERLKKEKQYYDALKDSHPAKKGSNYVIKLLGKIGDRTLDDMGTQVSKHFAAKGINKVLGGEYVFANNKKK